MRLVLTDQDLSGLAIEGQPFSYIGRCWGTDIKLVGDWTHVSHFANIFIRPDWSGARTRYSYSRFNAFRQAILSPDAELLDHEMMLALFAEAPVLGTAAVEAAKVATALDDDRRRADYLVSWSNLAPDYMAAMKNQAESAFRQTVGGREHLVKHLLKTSSPSDKDRVLWEEAPEPHIDVEGVRATFWGIVVRSKDGREYRRHWRDLPTPKNPHDRCELAGLIDAEVLKATDVEITTYVQSILPWRPYAAIGRQDRDWPVTGVLR